MMEAKVKWLANMQFVGEVPSGHNVLMDTRHEVGGENSAPAPMELLLIALGGCTGMDVVSILRKMKVEFESLEVGIRGERAFEHPKVYKKIELVYKVKGTGKMPVPPDKVKRAVELSQEKYCSITAMLKSTVEISYTTDIEPTQ